MNLIEFFDPKNLEHIKAFEHLQQKGQWPLDFWEKIKDMEIPNSWNYILYAKMADCWVEHMLKDKKAILESVTFYDLMQSYRHCTRQFQDQVEKKFEAVKKFILDNF